MYDVDRDQQLGPLDEVLDAGLDQRLEMILRLDHERAVPERVDDPAVRRATRRLVGAVEAEPDRELKGEVAPAPR